MGYYGSHWLAQPHTGSVGVWVDNEGKVTEEGYNLSDYEGERSFRGVHFRKLPAELRGALKEARLKARADARGQRDYAAARARPGASDKFKYAFLVTVGRGGTTICTDESPNSSARCSGYTFSAEDVAEIDRLGIPFVDSTTIPDSLICKTVAFPMWPSKPDEADAAPWGPLSFAPLEVLAWLYQALGATVRNITPREPTEAELRGGTAREAAAFKGYVTGDIALLGGALFGW